MDKFAHLLGRKIYKTSRHQRDKANEYYRDNKQKCRIRMLNWIKLNPKYIKEYSKNHPWIKTLGNIKQRCNNPKAIKYKYYGGRGIRCFLTSAQIRYLWHRDKAKLMEKASIDRIDSDGHYTLQNCRFVEMRQNKKRKKYTFRPLIRYNSNRVITLYGTKGEQMQNQEILSGEAARILGVHPLTITRMAESGRLKFRTNIYGWRLFSKEDVEKLSHEREKKRK